MRGAFSLFCTPCFKIDRSSRGKVEYSRLCSPFQPKSVVVLEFIVMSYASASGRPVLGVLACNRAKPFSDKGKKILAIRRLMRSSSTAVAHLKDTWTGCDVSLTGTWLVVDTGRLRSRFSGHSGLNRVED